jgi:hypothetical protein
MVFLGQKYFGGRPEHPGWAAFNKAFFRFTVFTITIVGAVTGTGIWLTTIALAPLGIAHMIRIFFWAWFFEYLIFFSEIVVLLILYFRWDSLVDGNARTLVRLGYAYVCLAVISAVAISANLGFMLTPGDWPASHRFWSAVLNPSFLPQLASRLSFAFMLGSLVAMAAVVFRGEDSFRADALRLFGTVLAAATVAFSIFLGIYVSVVPRAFTGQIAFSVLTSHFSRYPEIFTVANALFFAVIIASAAAAVARRAVAVKLLIVPAVISMLLLVTQFERIREFIRGPYLLPGHMYANGILLEEMPKLKATGVIAASPWFAAVYPGGATSRGAFLFAQNCSICHTVGGINDIRDRFRGRTPDGVRVILGHTHELAPFMPPFAGTDDERSTLADYLVRVGRDEVRHSSLSRSLVEVRHE